VRADFAGDITQASQPVRAEWAWRRGRMRHEYWPGGDPSTPSAPSDLPPGTTAVEPDLEDIVIALSLARRNTVPS
jgi:ABC-2 type transport system ATP-binding protein